MEFKNRLRRGAGALAAATLAVLTWSSPALADDAATGVRVILDRNNLPYSSLEGHPPGLDTEIATEVVRRIGRPMQAVWTDTLEEGLLTPVVTAGGDADLAVGVPIEPAAVEDRVRVGERVLYSLPYASTGYVLVTSRAHKPVRDMKDVGRGVIGVELGGVAASQLWDRGYLLRQFGSQDRILSALATGDLEYGVVWVNGGWLIGQQPTLNRTLKIQDVAIDMEKARWNLAVAVGHHNRALLPEIDGVIVAMKQEGAFEALFDKYGVPYFEPFEEEGTPTP